MKTYDTANIASLTSKMIVVALSIINQVLSFMCSLASRVLVFYVSLVIVAYMNAPTT